MSRAYRLYCRRCRYFRPAEPRGGDDHGFRGFCFSPLAYQGSTPLFERFVNRGCSDFRPKDREDERCQT